MNAELFLCELIFAAMIFLHAGIEFDGEDLVEQLFGLRNLRDGI